MCNVRYNGMVTSVKKLFVITFVTYMLEDKFLVKIVNQTVADTKK
jgi:hypothetical protein